MHNRDFYLACCGNEMALTKKVIQAVPEDQLDWRPHAKSRSPRELIGHLIGHEQDLVELSEGGDIHHRNQVPFETIAEALAMYEGAASQVAERVGKMDDQAWQRTGKLLVGDHVAWEAPASQLVWGLLFDTIHHRGQLTTYLRPMGAAVPSLYGPSADEGGH